MIIKIFSHRANAYQNHNEMSLHTFQMAEKKVVTQNSGQDRKKPNHSHIAGGDVNDTAFLEGSLAVS